MRLHWITRRLGALRRQPAFLGVAALLVAAIALASANALVHLRDRALADGDRNVQNLAYLLAEQTDRSLQSVKLVTAGIVDHLADQPLHSVAAFERLAGDGALGAYLRERISGLQHIDNVSITSARGKLVARSRPGPLPDVDLSGRDYLASARAAGPGELLISAPARSVTTGKWSIFLSQRVASPDGAFLGVVSAVLELDTLLELYSKIALGPNGTISIVRRDGVLLVRHPHLESMVGRSLAGIGAVGDLVQKGRNGTLRILSPVDGQDRIVGAFAARNFPVALLVTASVDDVLADWRQDRQILLARGLLAALIVLGVAVWAAGAAEELAEARAQMALAREKALTRDAERLQAEKFAHFARHDSLTGLANRLHFREELQARLACMPADAHLAVHYLDLDRFKAVNDTLGHPAGDILLGKVARRLRKTLRPTDLLARLGGDEFAILQFAKGGAADAEALAARVGATIARPFRLGAQTVSIGTSVGICLAPLHARDPDEIVRNADLALYAAKANGRGAFALFEPDMLVVAQQRVALEHDLRAAVEAHQFELHYQPQVDLSTGQIASFEALLRWRHPERGLINPGEFIGAAEDTGLIQPMGDWVIEAACVEAAKWPPHIGVAVNVSAVQFKTGDVAATIRRALALTGLPAHRLEVEVTESVMLKDTAANHQALTAIRALGVSLCMDDFGTGYSSLSCLTRFRFDRLKIDRSFTGAMTHRADALAVLRSAVGLAQSLGMRTTAEGVETWDQLAQAKAEGCTEAQGYLFGAAVPAAQVPALIAVGPKAKLSLVQAVS